MNAIRSIKKIIEYNTNIPRCETCRHFRKPFVFMTNNSKTKKSNHHCKLHDFTVAPNSICNTWISDDGKEILDL